MGNRICGNTIYFRINRKLQGFDLNDPNRPGCFVEPSNVSRGYEVIYYSRTSDRSETLGFEVRCP